SRKFADRYGLVLVRREGPPRGSNVFFHFQPAGRPLPRAEPDGPRGAEPVALPPRSVPEDRQLYNATYWVSCVSGKLSRPAPAKDLYISDWFLKARRYVESKGG